VVTALDAGLGAAEVLARPGSGQVVSVHRRAAYVRLDGGLIALVAPGVEPGPLHVRCTALPPLWPGEAVTVDGRGLAGRTWALRSPTVVWRGALPDPAALAARAGDKGVRAVARSAPPDAAAVLRRVGGPEGIDALAAVLGGRGPGLTPAGDDVLAGVVLVARVLGGQEAEDRLGASVAAVPTTEVSRAFLAWAARGQSIAPVHDWLLGLAAGDGPVARRALTRLHAIGADSGRSLAAGLALGTAQLPRNATHTARAGTALGLRH
jgi:uncharacterized protein DUF2877